MTIHSFLAQTNILTVNSLTLNSARSFSFSSRFSSRVISSCRCHIIICANDHSPLAGVMNLVNKLSIVFFVEADPENVDGHSDGDLDMVRVVLLRAGTTGSQPSSGSYSYVRRLFPSPPPSPSVVVVVCYGQCCGRCNTKISADVTVLEVFQ